MVRFVSIEDSNLIKETKKTNSSPFIGIDLGTTNSLVAVSNRQQPYTLPLGPKHSPLVPSILSFKNKIWSLATNLTNQSITSFKRSMEYPEIKIFDNYTAVDLSAQLLGKLKKLAELKLNQTVEKAVITVPAHFSDIARKATRIAAKQANIEVIRLLNEPTAAALAYGLNYKNKEGIFAVYDFGGGTFDVTILRVENNVFQILASAGNLHLGGNDIDEDILFLLGKDSKQSVNQKLAKKIKESNNKTKIISDLSFNKIIKKHFEKTKSILLETINSLRLEISDIDCIILIGGSTKLPLVYDELVKIFGIQKVFNKIDPECAVAIGAALHAETLMSGYSNERPLLLDIIPAALGIETSMGVVENIIPKYTPTPISVKVEFSTFFNNQKNVLINIVQGNSIMLDHCRSIGKFILEGIKPMPAGEPRITIVFSVDSDGILSVQASEDFSEIKKSIIIDPLL